MRSEGIMIYVYKESPFSRTSPFEEGALEEYVITRSNTVSYYARPYQKEGAEYRFSKADDVSNFGFGVKLLAYSSPQEFYSKQIRIEESKELKKEIEKLIVDAELECLQTIYDILLQETVRNRVI